ncbi:L,D-transpeptidase [Candidatus Woesearchaeota archaeon]|nr:L,D-transpeptidase [Candidatus Woesearchaeota archaeon]
MKKTMLYLLITLTLASCKPARLEENVEAAEQNNKPYLLVSKFYDNITFYNGLGETYSFDAAFGILSRLGTKKERGDKKTPEGEYYICDKRPSSSGFNKFMQINYPNPQDAKRGLEQGLINEYQYDSIRFAHRKGICPPSNTNLGGNIGIHGEKHIKIGKLTFKIGSFVDWTEGCIAIDNPNIEILYRRVPENTPITIE